MNMHPSALKPVFEVGKRYRTRQGWIVKLREFDADSVFPLGGMFDRVIGTHWWTASGNYLLSASGSPHERDLIPGAIEDEQQAVETRTTPYTVDERINEAYRRIEAQTATIASMAAKIEAVTEETSTARREIVILADAANQHTQRIQALEETAEVTEGNTKHIGTLQTAQIKTFERLDALETARAWIDTFEVKRSADAINAEIDDIKARINHHGIKMPEPTKPTIKGGWMNVYFPRGEFSFDRPYPTKAEAVARRCDGCIACIQIPDITEGEGL